jgi:transcriptional regulator with XRE-family HTH domain
VTGTSGRPDAEKLAGRNLRRLRQTRDWPLREVAERMTAYGYHWHVSVVAKIETGQRPFRLQEAVDLADLFDVSLADLFAAPVGPDALDDLRQEAAALHKALEQEKKRAETSEEQLRHYQDEHAVASAAVEKIQSRLRLLEQWEKEALGDGEA